MQNPDLTTLVKVSKIVKIQTRQHLQKSNMNEAAGVKGVPTTSYNPTSATSDNNHALQTIGSRLCELFIASFAKNVHTDQTTT